MPSSNASPLRSRSAVTKSWKTSSTFALDQSQFHRVPVAIAEMDNRPGRHWYQADFGGIFRANAQAREACECSVPRNGVFLVLDKNVQEFPWESMPIHRRRSVSRIPDSYTTDSRSPPISSIHCAIRKPYNQWTGGHCRREEGFFLLKFEAVTRSEERA
ncbi:hypothetical protein CPC08DRAFT_237566 [Agrocybe pediades]|nr:hypothetical protein CPC08DRAFT_237566 [Agrocybe pediades]